MSQLELVGALNAIAGTRGLEAAGAANAAATRISEIQTQLDEMAEAPSLLLSVAVEAGAVPETTTSATPEAFTNPCTGSATIGTRPVMFVCTGGYAYSSQVNGKAAIHLMEDGTQISVFTQVSATANAGQVLQGILGSYTPTPGEHTYALMKSKADTGTTANFIADDDTLDTPRISLLVIEL